MYKNKLYRWLVVLLVTFWTFACKKNLDVPSPVTQIDAGNVFDNDETAIAVLNGLYSKISSTSPNSLSGLPIITKKAGLSSDELTLYSGGDANDFDYYRNDLKINIASTSLSSGYELWPICYSYIYTCNSVIEGLPKSDKITPSTKKQLIGEAKFMRAFCYFYLVNLYGKAPIVTTTDYNVNKLLSRASIEQVYQLIVSDLKDAQDQLSQSFLNGKLQQYPTSSSTERVRPTSWAATALLSRVYLYLKDYGNAEAESSKVISNSLFALSPLSGTFLKNSTETIWQLQPVNKNADLFYGTDDARLFVLTAAPTGLNSNHPVYLSSFLISQFETGDQRKIQWTGTYTSGTSTFNFPYKYKQALAAASPSEYLVVFRLAEQYLIRAEARAQMNNLSTAINDLDKIRQRAGVSLIATTNPGIGKTTLLDKIMHERQVELFAELGHRWLDLKRTANIDSVMNIVTPIKSTGGAWHSYQQFYPLPFDDILRNPNLQQNEGY